MLLFAACKPKDPDCYQSVIVLNYTQFQTRYLTIDTVRIDSFSYRLDTIEHKRDSIMNFPEMLVLDEDSAYGVAGKEIAMLPSPFNPAKASIKYRFSADTTVKTLFDTLTFYYTPTPHFINNSCGYTYYYNLDSVKTTNNMLDSTFVGNPSLTDKNKEANVIFYFKRP